MDIQRVIINLLKDKYNRKLLKSLKNIKKYDPNVYKNVILYVYLPTRNVQKCPIFTNFDVKENVIFKIEEILEKKTRKLTSLLLEALQSRNNPLANEYVDLLHYFEFCDEYGTTPLWVASCCGNVEILEKLIKKGANVNPQSYLKTSNPFLVDSPLRTTLYKRKYFNYQRDKEEVFNYNRIIELLVENGAYVDSDMEKFLIFT